MQPSRSSREAILSAIRGNLPKQQVENPRIPVFRRPAGPLKPAFEQHLQQAGGSAHDVGSVAEAQAKLMALHPGAKVVCSVVPEIAGTRHLEKVRDPHELADVDVGVVRAQFGVAESGAVWLTQEDLVEDALAFLSQHLIVLLDPGEIVPDMHDAYRRVRLNETAYGCFMMGPSATADVEATVVHGAQDLDKWHTDTRGADRTRLAVADWEWVIRMDGVFTRSRLCVFSGMEDLSQ